ncbi:MAG: hypothetical protein LBE91_05075 [Tannerella sp.]|jgi:uncharacterized membrane-anchored protein|nr:hypothetical protein [Tannerella sp.]
MSAKSKSFATQINNAQVMSAGLKANLEALEKRGINEEFIAVLDANLNSIIERNNAQERLKAELKTSTAALEALLTDLNKTMTEAVKVVKLGAPQEQWKEFGITAKR